MIKTIPLKLVRKHLYCDICRLEMNIKMPIIEAYAYCGRTECSRIVAYKYSCENGHSVESKTSYPYDTHIEEQT